MIEVENLAVSAGDFSLAGISFAVERGSYAVLMGATGSGKTTLMEAICGLRRADSGTVKLGGSDVSQLPPGARGIGYVPQDGALFPTMTVRGQLGFGPAVQGWEKAHREERVAELSEGLGIAHLLDRMPGGLSGGERQRVALGRALAPDPEYLCLDEPLGALDEETHAEMVSLILRFTSAAEKTVLHITHSPAEAELVGDRVLRLRGGKIGEVG